MKLISVLWLEFFCYASLLVNINHICAGYGNLNIDLNEHMEDSFKKYEDALVDFLREEDHGDFELADIISLSAGKIEDDIDRYSNFEKMIIVDDHNIYRSNLTKPLPKGSDVEYVEWNNTLAWAAEEWVKLCQFKHGFSAVDNMTSQQGQNLYMGPSMLPSRPVYLWYQEYKYFDFYNFTCKAPNLSHMCARMTQMLWSDSSKIGCARRSYCFPNELGLKMVNCHYFQRGNKWGPGNQIYRYGWQCTRCELKDDNLCYRGLCISKKICKAYNLDCECKLDCKNCVKPNPKRCRCEFCKSGWDWEDCSFPCVNLHDIVKAEPGFCQRNFGITDSNYKKRCSALEIPKGCRRACKACQPLNKHKTNLCCNGKMCPLYHVLNEKCECQIDCPSKLCLYPPSTTTKYPLRVEITTLPPTSTSEEHYNKTRIPRRKQVKASSERPSSIMAAIIFMTIVILLLRE